jgi:5-methyltetrahydrofolate--homocysteine methyltransferase
MKAVAYLPYHTAKQVGDKSGNGKILMATVKEDVTILKILFQVVWRATIMRLLTLVSWCLQRIIAAARHNVDIIGLSGLITPSLDEMVYLAKELITMD